MPELAEVETVRLDIIKRLKGRKITELVTDAEDRYLFKFAPIGEVNRALRGRKILGAARKGKYFWLELDKKPWPIFHLGMSGNIAILDPRRKSKSHVYSWGAEKSERLWFCRLLVKFSGGAELGFTDPRRFGRMWLSDDPKTYPRIKALGYDPLIQFPEAKELAIIFKKRKTSIKTVLLDQKLFAGIGNWLADEILFQSKIAPQRMSAGLSDEEIKVLHRQVLAVVKKAVAVKADEKRFPRSWLFHHRWGKGKNATTSRGQKIIFDEVGGRTSAWVPGWQK